MIVRSFAADPLVELARFDFFNDYIDTRAWLAQAWMVESDSTARPQLCEALVLLDAAYSCWERKRSVIKPCGASNTGSTGEA